MGNTQFPEPPEVKESVTRLRRGGQHFRASARSEPRGLQIFSDGPLREPALSGVKGAGLRAEAEAKKPSLY